MSDYIQHLHLIPTHMQDAMLRWIEYAILPGSFLEAVLSNDLCGAFGRADATNQHFIKNYIEYLYNFAPSNCWGSPEKVAAWQGLKEKI